MLALHLSKALPKASIPHSHRPAQLFLSIFDFGRLVLRLVKFPVALQQKGFLVVLTTHPLDFPFAA